MKYICLLPNYNPNLPTFEDRQANVARAKSLIIE